MSTALDSTAEIVKLAHTLGVPPERLDLLAGIPAEDVRTLRSQVAEMLFQADKPRFVRLAALSKAAPTALAAKLTEHVFPPLLSARTAELLEPSRAVDLVRRLPAHYLADVSAVMDAARAPEVIAHIPADMVAKVASELARRHEWVVIGSFVAQVSAAGLRASVELFDGEQLLRIGYVLDDLARLDDLAGMLTGRQLAQMLSAAREHELWAQLDSLVTNLSRQPLARVAGAFADAPEADRSAAAAAVTSGVFSAAGYGRLSGQT